MGRTPARGFFFFNDTATTEIYTLSLHDALPISQRGGAGLHHIDLVLAMWLLVVKPARRDRVGPHAEVRAGQVLGPVVGLAARGRRVPARPLDDLHSHDPFVWHP